MKHFKFSINYHQESWLADLLAAWSVGRSATLCAPLPPFGTPEDEENTESRAGGERDSVKHFKFSSNYHQCAEQLRAGRAKHWPAAGR